MQDATCNSVGVDNKARSHIRERQIPAEEATDHPAASNSDSRVHETATCAHVPHAGGDDTAASRPQKHEDSVMGSPVDDAFPALPPSRCGHTKSRKQMVRDILSPWTPSESLQTSLPWQGFCSSFLWELQLMYNTPVATEAHNNPAPIVASVLAGEP